MEEIIIKQRNIKFDYNKVQTEKLALNLLMQTIDSVLNNDLSTNDCNNMRRKENDGNIRQIA